MSGLPTSEDQSEDVLVEAARSPDDRCVHTRALLAIALTMSRGFVAEVVSPAPCEGDDVVYDERTGIQVGERVVDGLAADVAACA
jgi:hypothetical protein